MILKELEEDVTKNFNRLVLMRDGSIGRLIGFKETEEDFYFILNLIRNDKYSTIYLSCVEDISYLENILTTQDYNKLDIEYLKLLPKENSVRKQ